MGSGCRLTVVAFLVTGKALGVLVQRASVMHLLAAWGLPVDAVGVDLQPWQPSAMSALVPEALLLR